MFMNYNIAKRLFDFLIKNNFFPDFPESVMFSTTSIPLSGGQNNYAIDKMTVDKEYEFVLKDYKKTIMAERLSIGCIVMNCNPFTLGHRYLIEKAAKEVKWLYVFVVEEDRSFFGFQDRYDLVKHGVRDIKNVVVLPSGKLMISSLTFVDYFNKTELQDKRYVVRHRHILQGDCTIYGNKCSLCWRRATR